MATHINMELFSHLGDVDIPEPTPKDLKWKASVDKMLERRNFLKINKALRKSIVTEGADWKVAYILSLRSKNDGLREYLSQDRPIYHCVDEYKPGQFAIGRHNRVSQSIRDLLASVYEVRQTDFIERNDYKVLHPQNARKWFLNENHIWIDTLLERCVDIISEEDVDQLLSSTDDKTSFNGLLAAAASCRDIDFIKHVVAAGASPFYEKQKAFHIAREYGKYDVADYLQTVMDERVTTGSKKTLEKPASEWQMMEGDTLIRSRALPDREGYLREYFDFAAGRLRSVQEDTKGVHPLFVENFTDIAGSITLDTAWDKYRQFGGTIDRDVETVQPQIQSIRRVSPID